MNCKHCEIELTASDRGFGKINECKDCASDVERYVGHMIWDHKTAPVIEIHANKDSLVALKDGRYNEGLKLVKEVKERSRRREGDCGTGHISVPYSRKKPRQKKFVQRQGFEIKIRKGSGRTYTSFPSEIINKVRKDASVSSNYTDEKKMILLGCANIPSHMLGNKRVEIWKDDFGYYIRLPKKHEKFSLDLDVSTTRSLGFRGVNFSRL